MSGAGQGVNRSAVVVADAQERILDAILDIRDSVSRRIRIQKFFDMKFRAMIRPAEDAIRKYYDDEPGSRSGRMARSDTQKEQN